MFDGDSSTEELVPPGEGDVVIDHLRPRPGVPDSPEIYRGDDDSSDRRRSPGPTRRDSDRNRAGNSSSIGGGRRRKGSSRWEEDEKSKKQDWNRSTEDFLRHIGVNPPQRMQQPVLFPPVLPPLMGYGYAPPFVPQMYPPQPVPPPFINMSLPPPGYPQVAPTVDQVGRNDRRRDSTSRERESRRRCEERSKRHRESRRSRRSNSSESPKRRRRRSSSGSNRRGRTSPPSAPPPPRITGDLRNMLSRRLSPDSIRKSQRNDDEEEEDLSLDSIYQEMERTERLRREVEQEKERLLQMGAAKEVPPPPPSLAEVAENKRKKTKLPPPKIPRPPTPPRLSNSDWKLADSRVAKYNFDAKPVTSTEETLRPGNYLLATWDAESVCNVAASGNLYQLGAFLPHGVGLTQCIIPSDCSEEEIKHSGLFANKAGKLYVKVNHKVMEASELKPSLENFLAFLEKGCQSARPKYDGVVLLSHLQESIPALLKAVRKNELQDRFGNTVKGVGDLCSYLAQCHMKKFASDNKQDLSLDSVYSKLFDERLHFHRVCEKKARATYFVLEKLLEGQQPNYANFFSKFIHPLGCRLIQKMVNFKTVRERVELFMPLQQYISRELAEQQVELIMEGVYAPSAEDESQYLSEPQQVALTMCKMLVSAGFDFDQLIAIYSEKGLADVELKLRTVFLDRMAGQPRAVVDQTIRTTRLVVGFFRSNGHRPIQELLLEAKLTEERLKFHPEVKDSGEFQEVYKELWEAYAPAADYFHMRLVRQNTTSNRFSQDLKVMADMMVNVLLQAKLDYQSLKTAFDREQMSFGVPNFTEYLTQTVGASYHKHGPIAEVPLEHFVGLVIDFLSGSAFHKSSSRQQQQPVHLPPGVPLASSSNFEQEKSRALESARMTLDNAINSSYCSDSFLSEYRHRLFTLAVVKMYLVQCMEPLAALCGGNVEHVHQIAEHVARLLAFLGFDHAKLKRLWEVSEASLAGNLFAGLRENVGLLPPGFTNETLVDHVVNYFKSMCK